MLYINKITDSAFQNITLTGLPGIQINMTLQYMPRPQSWILGLQYLDRSIQGIAVVSSVNLLRQFRRNLPFGIMCLRPDGLDPYLADDFSQQRTNLYLLDASDVATVEAEWFE